MRDGAALPVLCKALGTHSDCFALSEICNLTKQLKIEDTLCGCASYLGECDFWDDILKTISNKRGISIKQNPDVFNTSISIVHKNKYHKMLNIIKYFLMLLSLRKYNDENIEEAIKNTFQIYDTVFDKTKTNVLIDSSKNLHRALLLESHSKKYNIKFIHLVRDGRAVLYSTQKGYYKLNLIDENKNEVTITKQGKKGQPTQMIKGWYKGNLMVSIILNLFRRRKSIFIRHEDLSNEPEKTLKKLTDFIAIPYQPDMMLLGNKINHMIGGNASRINAKEIRKSSVKWRENLNKELALMFNKKAGWLNRVFGYK